MKFLNSRVLYSLLFYVMAIMLIIVAKPDLMFSSNGEIKSFGVGVKHNGEPKTIFSFGVFVIVLAIVSFYVFALIDVVFK
jgi:hypothetical protein